MLQNSRRLDRERVLAILYEVEMKAQDSASLIAELPVEPDAFVVETVNGVDNKRAELDTQIERHARGWDLQRMASVDRNILRLGAWELTHRRELSVAIIISEAIELAKRYSTDDSGRFINGILSAIGDETRLE